MPFMVIYRTSDGSSCYEHAAALDEAALFVERLRNKDAIDQVRIYRMEEISFAFRPYYKVELGSSDRATAPADLLAREPLPEPAAEPLVPEADAAAPSLTVVPPATSPPPPAEPGGSSLPPPPSDQKAAARQGLFGR